MIQPASIPALARTPEHEVTIARMVTESLLEQAQAVERTHAANLADPGLGPAVARTAELVQQAEYIELQQADEQRDIVEAHGRGLTIEQFQDRIDKAIAYAESPEYAQAIWERQGAEYAAGPDDDTDAF
jgi:hypothetical protein